MANDDKDPRDDPAATLALIKQIHARGGRALTREEMIEFITKPIYLGQPVARSHGTTPAQLLDWCLAEALPVSDEFRALVKQDEELRAKRNPKGAGRPPKPKTQYERAYERNKGWFHRWVRLPAAGAKERSASGLELAACVQSIAAELKATATKPTTKNIMAKLPDKFYEVDESSVRRALKRPLK